MHKYMKSETRMERKKGCNSNVHALSDHQTSV